MRGSPFQLVSERAWCLTGAAEDGRAPTEELPCVEGWCFCSTGKAAKVWLKFKLHEERDASFSRLRLNLQIQPLTPSHNFNHILFAGFHFTKGVRVVVDILNLARSNLDNSIASLKSGF